MDLTSTHLLEHGRTLMLNLPLLTPPSNVIMLGCLYNQVALDPFGVLGPEQALRYMSSQKCLCRRLGAYVGFYCVGSIGMLFNLFPILVTGSE